jgi:hypothetical protein
MARFIIQIAVRDVLKKFVPQKLSCARCFSKPANSAFLFFCAQFQLKHRA